MNIESTERREVMLGAVQAAIWGATLAATSFPAATANPVVPGADIAARLPQGASSRFATVNGIQVHYVAAGTGPAVVLLHGWPQTWFAWHGTIERLSQSFSVIAPDLRGIGLSEKTSSGYDKRTIAADIRELIVHAAGGRANVIGHDMGGKAAYMLAHLHPECIEHLVLVDCLLPGTESADALRGGAWHYGFHMAPQIPEMLTQGREREYIQAQIRLWSYRKDAVTEEAISEFARHYASPGGMTAGFNYYRTLREDAELAASFGNHLLGMPILAIGGRHSAGTRLAEALYRQSTRLKAVIAEDSGHFVAEEVPNFFGEQVELFLRA